VLRAPQRALISFDSTLSEMTGPTFGHSIIGPLDNDLIHNFARPGESAIGQRTIVHGHVLDENARPVPNVLVEFWQANAIAHAIVLEVSGIELPDAVVGQARAALDRACPGLVTNHSKRQFKLAALARIAVIG
jgi:hypothetical protein